MNEIVERLARAIAGQPDGDLDNRWRRKAVAGLLAIRNPTDAMLRDSEVKTIGPARLGIWWAMIDAALAEDHAKAL